jgi:hypothetical protein
VSQPAYSLWRSDAPTSALWRSDALLIFYAIWIHLVCQVRSLRLLALVEAAEIGLGPIPFTKTFAACGRSPGSSCDAARRGAFYAKLIPLGHDVFGFSLGKSSPKQGLELVFFFSGPNRSSGFRLLSKAKSAAA